MKQLNELEKDIRAVSHSMEIYMIGPPTAKLYSKIQSQLDEIRLKLDRLDKDHLVQTEESDTLLGKGQSDNAASIYKLIGKIKISPDQAVHCVVKKNSLDVNSQHALQNTMTDIEAGKPLPTYASGSEQMSGSFDMDDLRVISDAINIRSNGQLYVLEDQNYLADQIQTPE